MSFGEDIKELVERHSQGQLGIHPTWRRVRLEDVAYVTNGFAYKSANFDAEKGTPLLRIRDILSGNAGTFYNAPANDPKMKFVEDGDIVIGMDGDFNSRIWGGGEALINQRVCTLRADQKYYSQKLLSYALPGYLGLINEHTSSVTVKHLSSRTVQDIPLPLPPLNEQHRIVEKIETLFARIDKGEEALREVQQLLKRYRQSILKAAVTGELTRDWREANQHKLEPASDLLARILEARWKNWQGRGKYKEPMEPNSKGLATLPYRWVWASVDHVLRDGLSNGRSVRSADDGFPVLRLTALKDGRIDLTEFKIGAWSKDDAAPYCIEMGDVLVSRGNGSKKLVGRGGLVDEQPQPIAFPDTMIRIPLNLACTDAEWFIHLWNSPFMRSQIEAKAKTTAGIYKINQGDIRSFVVPLPPIAEQRQISAQIAESMASISSMERTCERELSRSDSLRQSILKSAFTGQLVPQDPNDEPASELLARVRAEREEVGAKKHSKKKASRKESRAEA